MFQPETEDMLPRAAPKPSVQSPALGPESVVKPQVPEVSILFGPQQDAARAASAPPVATQTYAAWKRQVLPKVTFPPEGAEVTGVHYAVANSVAGTKPPTPEYGATRSNLYPLRTITATIQPTMSANSGLGGSSQPDTLLYRRSLDSVSLDVGVIAPSVTLQQLQQQQRRSLDAVPQSSDRGACVATDVLTICATTQTDAADFSTHTSQYVTKIDIEQLLVAVQTIREDQVRLMQICETLLLQQLGQTQTEQLARRETSTREVGLQCELSASSEGTPAEVFHVELAPQPLPHNNYYAQPQFQSPCSAPTAQSTAYRANTPRVSRPLIVEAVHNNNNNRATVLPKPSTEKSRVMNELALKYLPNEKLNELLQELHVSPAAAKQTTPPAAAVTPLRAIENMEKSPNDLSNASYKYLKKYRLLPEQDANNYQEPQQHLVQPRTPLKAQQQEQRQSPYQRVQSPLAAPVQQAQMLDLENIRNQPKFL